MGTLTMAVYAEGMGGAIESVLAGWLSTEGIVLTVVEATDYDHFSTLMADPTTDVGVVSNDLVETSYDNGFVKDLWDERSEVINAGMHYSDYEVHLAAVTEVVDGIAASKNPAAAKALSLAADKFLLVDVHVRVSSRAGQNADRPLRRLARAVLGACGALNCAGIRPTLEALSERDDLGTLDDARVRLAELDAHLKAPAKRGQ